jgi:hypothetical protein
MLDSIDKEIQLFIVALDKSENDILAGGAEARYLLERFASLKQSYEQCKKTIDFLKSGLWVCNRLLLIYLIVYATLGVANGKEGAKASILRCSVSK